MCRQQRLEKVREERGGERAKSRSESQRVFWPAGLERSRKDDHFQNVDWRHKEHGRRHLRVWRERQ